MKNEIVKSDDNLLTERSKNAFCSKMTGTIEDKKELYNALEKCDLLLKDVVNQEINIKDVYIEKYEKLDNETGEVKTKFRTILFDVDGTSYATGSYGIANAIEKMILIFGKPTWEDGIKVKVENKKLDGNRTSLTLTLV